MARRNKQRKDVAGVSIGRIDDRILVRQLVRSKLTELASGELKPAAIDKELQKLANFSPYSSLGAVQCLQETGHEIEAQLAAGLLLAQRDELALARVSALLSRRDVTDIAKGQILRLLTAVGFEPGALLASTVFSDIKKHANRSLELLFSDLAEDENILGYVLEELATLPFSMQFGYVQDIARAKDNRATKLLQAIAQGAGDEPMAAEAAKGLGAIGDGVALGALLEVSARAGDAARRQAERESRKLAFRGVKPITHIPKALGEMVRVAVTNLDGQGFRIVWVARYVAKKRGKVITANFLVSIHEGIKDCYGSAHSTRRESTSYYKSASRGQPLVEDDLAYATAVMRDALHVNQSTGTPLPLQWEFWKTVFGPDALTPEQMVPQLPDEARGVGSEITAAELLQLDELAEWYEEDPLVYQVAEELHKIERRFRSAKSKIRATDAVLRKAATTLFQPRLPQIIRMLDMTGEFLRRRGKGEPANELMRIALHLRSGESAEQNLFLRDLLAMSVRVAEHNLKIGYDRRRTPRLLE